MQPLQSIYWLAGFFPVIISTFLIAIIIESLLGIASYYVGI
jgi:hypothetical protein